MANRTNTTNPSANWWGVVDAKGNLQYSKGSPLLFARRDDARSRARTLTGCRAAKIALQPGGAHASGYWGIVQPAEDSTKVLHQYRGAYQLFHTREAARRRLREMNPVLYDDEKCSIEKIVVSVAGRA